MDCHVIAGARSGSLGVMDSGHYQSFPDVSPKKP